MSSDGTSIINTIPIGWWYQDERNDTWTGPFKTYEAAEKIAMSLAPEKSSFVRFLNVQAWEKREVHIPKYRTCPHCKGGFVGDRCCRYCDGTNRLEVK